jgi:TrmH family RNA methyltransferase
MLSKAQVKYIQSLGQKKFRDESGQFLVEGTKIIKELIVEQPQLIKAVYALPAWISANEQLLQSAQIMADEASEQDMEKISGLPSPSEVIAIMIKPVLKIPEGKGIILLLDGIQDPGNLGTIIRTADWFGVKQIVCGWGTADCYNPKVVQSTMGSVFRVNIIYEDIKVFIAAYPKLPVVASSLDGKPIHKASKPKDMLLVIGNESKGVQKSIEELATNKVLIPGFGKAESLNAAVATGILLHHFTLE